MCGIIGIASNRPVSINIINSLKKTKNLLRGVVKGIGGYGNCIGVPTIAGQTNFDESYLADDVHYNELGAKFIADIYFLGIQSEYSSTNLSDLKILPLGDSRVEGNRPWYS